MTSTVGAIRTVVARCFDWPIVALGVPPEEPVAIMKANKVVACSAAARSHGVRVGHLKREAQSRCVDLQVLPSDAKRDAQTFEVVVAALDEVTPQVEVYGPGAVGFPARGPSTFFGGEQALAARVQRVLREALFHFHDGYGEYMRVGIADGAFAAKAAVTHSPPSANGLFVVEAGCSAAFLADQPITLLEDKSLVEVLSRLGFTRLGGWAALPVADVIGRFGRDGVIAHRLANGLDEVPLALRTPAPDFTVSARFEPPCASVEQCVHMGERLAHQLVDRLRGEGRTCLRLGIEAETENGASLSRWWRYQGTSLSASVIATRVRWQLEGWLQQDESNRPRSGVLKLSLVPEEVLADSGSQITLWDVDTERAEEVARIARRVEKMGAQKVSVIEHIGGIGPRERIVHRSATSADGAIGSKSRPFQTVEPWPGQLPAPSPARVFAEPVVAEVADSDGRPVVVDGRGDMLRPPDTLRYNHQTEKIVRWAGPWLDDQYWWDKKARHRRARVQAITSAGSAYLLVLERQHWWIEAAYD